MRRLIVNADDFGRTAGVNRGVVEAHRHGIVTSATLMVNYDAAPEAARLAIDCPGLGVGLHVALTGGVPALPPESVRSLVDARGRLPARPEGLAGAQPAEILAEARAQLARFQALLGRAPSHFDSHHHSHRQPAVLDAVIALARETGRPVRCASAAVAERLRAERIATTDAFVESFYGEAATLGTLNAILDALPEGTTELMCHPGHPDAELLAGSSYGSEREQERVVLTSDAARRAVAERGIRLASFAEL